MSQYVHSAPAENGVEPIISHMNGGGWTGWVRSATISVTSGAKTSATTTG
jgi:hypothetical protein